MSLTFSRPQSPGLSEGVCVSVSHPCIRMSFSFRLFVFLGVVCVCVCVCVCVVCVCVCACVCLGSKSVQTLMSPFRFPFQATGKTNSQRAVTSLPDQTPDASPSPHPAGEAIPARGIISS